MGSGIRGYLTVVSSPPQSPDLNWLKVIYLLPEGGEIHHLLAPKERNKDMDFVYQALQEARLEFKRMPVKSKGASLILCVLYRERQ